MPLYAYKCTACAHEFEKIQKMSDPNPQCPHKVETPDKKTCDAETERLISQGSFQLNGSGWEADGYA